MVAFNINIKFVKETQSRNEYCDEAVPSTSGCRKNFFAEFDESNSHTSTLDDKIKRISYEKDDISEVGSISFKNITIPQITYSEKKQKSTFSGFKTISDIRNIKFACIFC
uniref:Uncharacterized protein n=1 Tax=Photinus pyralis TaxID=7054 RepID=A0A1Y1LZV5_PHOPY